MVAIRFSPWFNSDSGYSTAQKQLGSGCIWPPSRRFRRLGPCFVDYVEGCLSRSTKAAEAGRSDNLPNPFLPCLRTQAEGHLLRSGAGSAQQGGERVVDPSHGIQIVFQLI